MKTLSLLAAVPALLLSSQLQALSMAPEEFVASRSMACVLAEQSLGTLTESEYGARVHTVLDGFDDSERDGILSKAIGYMDGLMFNLPGDDQDAIDARLRDFVGSDACDEAAAYRVTVSL